MVLEKESYESFLETMGYNFAMEGDIAKTVVSRSSHGIFCVVSLFYLVVN